MTRNETDQRQAIIDAYRRMNAFGINQGTSGDISVRHDGGSLITPTSVPSDAMTAGQIVLMTMDGCFADVQTGTPPVLPSDEIERVRRKMTGYGHADG